MTSCYAAKTPVVLLRRVDELYATLQKTAGTANEVSDNQETGLLPCLLCHEEFMNKQSLKIHERKHRSDRSFTCKGCEITFLNLSSLNLHLHLTGGCANNAYHV